MKNIPLIIVILISTIYSIGQDRPEAYFDEPLIVKSNKELKPLVLDSSIKCLIKNEDKKLKFGDEIFVVKSGLLVNDDPMTDILFTQAKLNGDTLDILIYQTDESHDHNYKIKVIRDKYIIHYDFSYPADTTDRKIQTMDFKLILNRKNFYVGQELKGYTEFIGQCLTNCYESRIVAKGFFKVTVE